MKIKLLLLILIVTIFSCKKHEEPVNPKIHYPERAGVYQGNLHDRVSAANKDGYVNTDTTYQINIKVVNVGDDSINFLLPGAIYKFRRDTSDMYMKWFKNITCSFRFSNTNLKYSYTKNYWMQDSIYTQTTEFNGNKLK